MLYSSNVDELPERRFYSRPGHDFEQHWRLHEAERHFGHGFRGVSRFPLLRAHFPSFLTHTLIQSTDTALVTWPDLSSSSAYTLAASKASLG